MNEATREKEKKWLKLMMLPLSIMVGFIPMIVRMKETYPKENVQGEVLHISEYVDCFSQNKAYVLMIMTIVMATMLFLFWDKHYLKKNKYIWIGIFGISIFEIMVIISTVFSEYKELALWGTYDRAEGLITISCYIIVFLYTIYAFNNYKDIYFIIIPLMLLILVNVVLGISQYFGFDFYVTNDLVKKIIVPENMAEAREELKISYDNSRIYGTVGHYNYMGSFTALLVPFFAILVLMLEDSRKRLILGLVLVQTLFLLFGSTSRAGLVSVLGTILLMMVFLGKLVMKQWKKGLGVLGVLAVLLVILNLGTKGNIFSRIPSLVKDILQITQIENGRVDYRDYLPIREIKNEEGEVVVVVQEGEIHFNCVNRKVVITDINGKQIIYNKEQNEVNSSNQNYGNYTTQDALYSNIEFKLGTLYINQEEVDAILIKTGDNKIHFVCRIDYDNEAIQQVDEWSGKDVQQETPPSIGFSGYEKLGSSRGYIWSRVLPMLKETIFIGKGPDSFIAYFPKYDRLAKLWAYENQDYVVDKPHNLYLQIAFNEGWIALIGFVILVGSYIVQSTKLYAFKKKYRTNEVLGLAIMSSIIGYLASGIFNDSVVSVAPIFWVFLGIGFAINEKIVKESKQSEQVNEKE